MAKKRSRSVEKKSAKQEKTPETTPETLPLVRQSDEPVAKKVKWTNKNRVLVFSARGATQRDRHLMNDVREMMPHSKPESKMEKKDPYFVINEICEMKNCNRCVFFEGRKKQDLYVWLANVPKGPCAKFLLENIHTMGELKMTGNCLKGSRPLLSFDKTFDTKPHWAIMKELLTQIFSTPRAHPKSQPFFDHVFTFCIYDNRIWFRNFQIVEEDGQMAEIGPRFVMNPIKLFEGSFGGQVLWENPDYVSPNMYRRIIKKATGMKYRERIEQKISKEVRKPDGPSYNLDPLDEVFETEAPAPPTEPVSMPPPASKKKRRKGKKVDTTPAPVPVNE
nr:EOG090X07MB [Triops cancriformis]